MPHEEIVYETAVDGWKCVLCGDEVGSEHWGLTWSVVLYEQLLH